MAGIVIPSHKSNLPRPTEGSKQTGAVARTRNLSGAKRSAGRPAGSKNRSKSLIPTDLADEMLVKMKDSIPAEHYEYLRKVIKGGDVVSTEKELDILILLLGRNLHPALIEETHAVANDPEDPDAKGITVFRKDVTERLKVLNSLLSLRHQMDKSKDEGKDGKQPLLTIVADRKLLEGGRLGVLLGGVPGPVAGDSDGVERRTLPARTVSSPISE